LAEIAGPTGRAIALERSHRFVSQIRARGAANIEAVETDLLDYDWPVAVADAVWCRWVLAFVADPAKVLRGMARALKPGGVLVIQEYFDYAAWRLEHFDLWFTHSLRFEDNLHIHRTRRRSAGRRFCPRGLERSALRLCAEAL
jgi:SAM-dependent methyltransferase